MRPPDGTRIRGFQVAADQDLDGYRAYLDSVLTVPIDAASEIPLGRSIDGMDDLKRFLLEERRDQIAENVRGGSLLMAWDVP
ncbi:MAG: hypothetical protein R3B96_06640 [Pirellulaceae bacterium]